MDVTKDETGVETEVLLYGCFKHSDHTREKRFLRISAKTKEKIVELHRLGVPPEEIKRKHFDLSEETEENNNEDSTGPQNQGGRVDKPLTKQDVKRICRKNLPNPDTRNWGKPEAMFFLLEKSDVHLFNFASVIEDQEAYLNDTTRKKFHPTEGDRFLFFRMSDFGRKMFRANPHQLFVDGTFKCCNEDIVRVNWVVLDRRGEGVIIATGMVKTEREDLLTLCLEKMFELEPEVRLKL